MKPQRRSHVIDRKANNDHHHENSKNKKKDIQTKANKNTIHRQHKKQP